MSQKTAVEWLYERFLFAGYAVPSEWKEQAKEMEKEQIQQSYKEGAEDGVKLFKNELKEYLVLPNPYKK